MTYGKLTNSQLQITSIILLEGNGVITNPTNEQFIEYGYKEIIRSTQPEYQEGFEITESYTENDTQIIVNYELIEQPIIEVTV